MKKIDLPLVTSPASREYTFYENSLSPQQTIRWNQRLLQDTHEEYRDKLSPSHINLKANVFPFKIFHSDFLVLSLKNFKFSESKLRFFQNLLEQKSCKTVLLFLFWMFSSKKIKALKSEDNFNLWRSQLQTTYQHFSSKLNPKFKQQILDTLPYIMADTIHSLFAQYFKNGEQLVRTFDPELLKLHSFVYYELNGVHASNASFIRYHDKYYKRKPEITYKEQPLCSQFAQELHAHIGPAKVFLQLKQAIYTERQPFFSLEAMANENLVNGLQRHKLSKSQLFNVSKESYFEQTRQEFSMPTLKRLSPMTFRALNRSQSQSKIQLNRTLQQSQSFLQLQQAEVQTSCIQQKVPLKKKTLKHKEQVRRVSLRNSLEQKHQGVIELRNKLGQLRTLTINSEYYNIF